jgi:outer membrane protein OmpA-like peptidoglycan-associated protein
VRIAIVVALLVARAAAADPISFGIQPDVPIGKKPMLRITAAEPVSDVRCELDRDDGKHFAMRHPRLGKGQSVTLPVGDGSAGRASYKGTLSAQLASGQRYTEEVTFDTRVRAPLDVGYDMEHLDLDKHVLGFKPSRGVVKATLVVLGDDGTQLGTGEAGFDGKAGGTWLQVAWTQPAGSRVLKLQLHVEASDGVVTDVELIPWSIAIEHEDVNFRTDSAVIDPDERGKLDASYAKIADIVAKNSKFVKLQLYVAGHTDTVGPAAKNRTLSLARATAIGRYFRDKGITIPIAVAGYGEDVLKVQTPDNTDERRNRRADYVIGPQGGKPPFHGPYLKVKADWRALK